MSVPVQSWIDRLDGRQAAAVAALLERATVADGTAPVSEQGVLAVSGAGGGDVRHLVETDGDRIVGYAQLQPGHGEHPAMAELAVDPESRGRGIGGRLVTEVLSEGGPDARVWAHGNLPAAQAVAQRLGLSGARELLQLRRPLEGAELPELVVPDDISIREYRGVEDDPEVLRVNAAAFAWHPEQGSWTDRDIAERRAEDWFDPAGLFMAFAASDETRLLGFHWTKVHPQQGDEPAIGEVYVVAIGPDAQGRGLGRLLTLAGLHYLRDRGLGAVLLYVEGDNASALHTYDRLGFERFHTDIAYARG
ncbi:MULTISPECIES: mycothiol synthase [unclassified Rhodococcus (in: high G+C Gram-positive bacteria)]|uniref:mycothiol synthase n=1 Tax=unclassified Rhodococcus (in: high G+C Gram-positive bacteria) TaxID=192944 RepID=UPI001639EAAA|nr:MULTISPECIES: mycothiol synthase [unclassified Rhodococcus (in: high G+C Gram-positive bacteria)]MBC2639847.1 mycothiol synthase [Rhodococcus sp. 3A]MBC2895407.1 mycothiol synthase [Rhodococcus sp. 4CII]